jgi:hypothetical protein
MTMAKLQKLTAEDVTISIKVEPETEVRLADHFNSGDDDHSVEADLALIEEIEQEIAAGSKWAWCSVTVTVEWNGTSEEETVGCLSYKDEADFKADGYYSEMVKTALSDLNAELELKFAQLFELALPLPKKADFQQLLDVILPILPNASFDQDSDGQVTINTGFKLTRTPSGVETISEMEPS